MKNSVMKALMLLLLFTSAAFAADPLPSWTEGNAKQSIITFVETVTKPGSPDCAPVPERIAVFDNEGTLWSEQPLPVQLFLAIHRVKALAPQHPEWAAKEPFASVLKGELKTAKNPKAGKRFLDMTYQPMLEVLAYLRANGFKNVIVSDGGIEFMRPWAEQAYGVPPENVVGINQHIGRRPIAAFGNSVGDQQMLEYTQGGSGARYELLVLHDDAAREFA